MTSQKIKKVALELMAQKGYEGTSLSEIANKVGIKKPSIYGHFLSKEELFFSVLNEEMIRFELYIKKMLIDVEINNIQNTLFDFLKGFIQYFYKDSARRGFWSGIIFFPPFELREKIKIKLNSIDELIYNNISDIISKRIKVKGISKKDLDKLVYSYICILKGSFTMLIYDDKFNIKRLKDIWEIYLSGIEEKIVKNDNEF
ncbi:TetR/AcrR family transcriptional regulator [Tepidibacter formicigenes]|jgi:AcrR family transcriptional regulator|uniref:Transcriptional regulator, TetR family n=1 Tax=Tepidibacter formicigenes DSM 15518 TaxID=1123349 RepID=A0A1M6JP92_9FIRM|nr:TetR/AcrR family transcriptional regulator [Tepidibacter formicigenes]SHJ48413.1 transcriptional regulator, TetR family [Tepidibacter formicigenes DSM 15518]